MEGGRSKLESWSHTLGAGSRGVMRAAGEEFIYKHSRGVEYTNTPGSQIRVFPSQIQGQGDRIPDPDQQQRILAFLTQIIVTKIWEI
jgi:hypothetical protein